VPRLGVTAVVAYALTASPVVVQAIASNHLLFLGALVAELGLVFYLSARVQGLAPNAAMLLFLLYSGLNGVTLSVVLLRIPAPPSRRRSWSPPGCSGRSPPSARRRSAVWPARTVLLHGTRRAAARVDPRPVLAQRRLQFLISVVGVIVSPG